MNSLIVLKEEISEQTGGRLTAVIRGQHLRYLRDLHDLEKGRKLKINILNECLGYGEITASSAEELVLQFTKIDQPKPLNAITLIVAVPRPQTQKKIIHLAASVGVARLMFVRCANTDKSYLTSKSLHPDAISFEMMKGLEQSGQSLAPNISVWERFKPFFEDTVPDLLRENQRRIIFDTVDLSGVKAVSNMTASESVLAFGPESGWNDHERATLKSLGFSVMGLGPRILRCETAVALALGRFIDSDYNQQD